MRLSDVTLLAAFASCGVACGPAPTQEQSKATPAAQEVRDSLPAPYSAAQIREEGTPGFTLEMERTTPEGWVRGRRTVIDADEDTATIAFERLDGDRQVQGGPRVQTARWNELRDHALFPISEGARRERARRKTALGTFDGWLYTISDPAQGTVSEYFFGAQTPGAPLLLVTRAAGSEGDVRLRLEQVVRSRPKKR